MFVFTNVNQSYQAPKQPKILSTLLNASWFIETVIWYWQLYSDCTENPCTKYRKCKLQILMPLNQCRETWNTRLTFPGLNKEPTNSYNSAVIELAACTCAGHYTIELAACICAGHYTIELAAGTCAGHYTINRGSLPTILIFTLILK
jgi:hypothetical protein